MSEQIMSQEHSYTILVIDDDPAFQRSMKRLLKGYRVLQALSFRHGLEHFERERPDVVLVDINLPDGDGLVLMELLRNIDSSVPVIVISGRYDVDTTTRALKGGAYDFLPKPLDKERFESTLKKALEAVSMNFSLEGWRLESALGEQLGDPNFVVKSTAMKKVISKARKAAESDAPVLLLGPTGVGKTYLARLIHKWSRRASNPFVALNVSAIPEALLESELFGYVKGAFTGADTDKKGLFDSADGGTILLDEIGDLPKHLQVKLLQVIQEGKFFPVGSTIQKTVNVRIIAATVQDLPTLVETGEFREDLFFRLYVYPIMIPPLVQRREDIPPLSAMFLKHAQREHGGPPKRITPELIEYLMELQWRGNVRELRSAIYYAYAHASASEELRPEHLAEFRPRAMDSGRTDMDHEQEHIMQLLASEDFSLDKYVDETTSKIIDVALERSGHNLTRAADLLGITRRRLGILIKKLGVEFHGTRGRPRKN